MITVSIGSVSRTFSLGDVDEQWISAQINNRRKEGALPCVEITLEDGPWHLRFRTKNCPPPTGGRQATPDEAKVLGFWDDIMRTEREVNPGAIISFLHRLPKMLERI